LLAARNAGAPETAVGERSVLAVIRQALARIIAAVAQRLQCHAVVLLVRRVEVAEVPGVAGKEAALVGTVAAVLGEDLAGGGLRLAEHAIFAVGVVAARRAHVALRLAGAGLGGAGAAQRGQAGVVPVAELA